MFSQEEGRLGRRLVEFEGRYMNDVDYSKANQMAELETVNEYHIRQMSLTAFLRKQALQHSFGITALCGGILSEKTK